MRVSVRSSLMAGVAALAAGTIAIPPSIAPTAQAPAPVHAAVRLAAETRTAWAPRPVIALIPKTTAAARPAAAPAAPVGTATAGKTTAAPAAAVAPTAAALAFPGLSNAIIQGYDWAIGWVDYGVDLAQYAVGWIPVANIFAPQIGIVYYSLIRPIITSAVYNTAAVIGGQIDLIQGIGNVVNDSITAGRGFVQAEINWALSWLPPLPPLPFAATSTSTAAKTPAAVSLTATAEPTDGKPPVTAEQTDRDNAHATEPVVTQPAKTQPAETQPAETKPVSAEPAPTPTDSTPVEEPSDNPASSPSETSKPETKPDTTKPDKPDTKPSTDKTGTDKTDTKNTDTKKTGTEKTDTKKTDTDKPAPKKAEPKKRDRPSASDSAPKADTHAGSDAP
ncbi:hypothetical protein [Mycolicibacterium sp. J2]|uniref:hypothetical protein n=1 Tax=Mycolicibacterium sp. J2 TaxID=2993511 RepID=UPI00224B0126|nr:hypothetical protein [Mycolicibacterium sp. J2]MCX2714544.1 hypothetical protein [Mycolicibacterium sp. J2]